MSLCSDELMKHTTWVFFFNVAQRADKKGKMDTLYVTTILAVFCKILYHHIHYIAKGFRTTLQITEFSCSKTKHLGMQTASTNICGRMCGSQELTEFKCDIVIGRQ